MRPEELRPTWRCQPKTNGLYGSVVVITPFVSTNSVWRRAGDVGFVFFITLVFALYFETRFAHPATRSLSIRRWRPAFSGNHAATPPDYFKVYRLDHNY